MQEGKEAALSPIEGSSLSHPRFVLGLSLICSSKKKPSLQVTSGAQMGLGRMEHEFL